MMRNLSEVRSGVHGNATAQNSPWHSPVPYLFGGLAAMLGLIAFALLILACSYWKLSGYLDSGENGEGDLENGKEKAGETVKLPTIMEANVVVIMAGEAKPTYLATPATSRASSFGDNNSKELEKTERVTEKESQDQEEHNQSQ